MNLYRYEFEDGEGFIRGSDRLVITDEDDDELSDIIGIFDKSLPTPDMDIYFLIFKKSIRTKSYFTEYGNTKFHEPIQNLLDFAKEKGVKVNCFSFSDQMLSTSKVVYRDMFQVIYAILDQKGSTTIMQGGSPLEMGGILLYEFRNYFKSS